jgi:hypothetical protein
MTTNPSEKVTVQPTLTPDPSPTLRERGVFREKSAGAGSPLSRSMGKGSGVRVE